MMDQMIQVAESLRAGLQDRLRGAVGDQVQGANLELDRYWYEWSVFRHSGHFFLPLQPMKASCAYDSWEWFYLVADLPPWDFTQLPRDWFKHCIAMGYGESASPFVVRVILREDAESKDWPRVTDLPRSYEGYPLIYERRPPIVATSALRSVVKALGFQSSGDKRSSISVGRADPMTSGTLGGFLSCPITQRKYLVSCAHVFGPAGPPVYSPGPFENRNSKPIGTVRFCEVPPLRPPGQDCNLIALPNAGRIDVAVAEVYAGKESDLKASPSAHLMRRASKMCPYQRVSFVGKESGRVDAQLSAVTLWHEIEFKNFGDGPAGVRCFGAIFEMSDFRGDRQQLANEGDSGAWIFDDLDDLRSWNGMLIARQGRRAYGCYAEFIMSALATCPAFPALPVIHW